jgi:type I restriction enzyme S subunit
LVDPRWIEYLLLSPVYQRALDALKVGTSDSSVSIGNDQILALEIPVPSLAEQKRIVEDLDDHLSRLDKVLAEVEATMLNFETLERSSLEANFQVVLDSEQAESLPLSAVTDKVKSLDPKTLGVQEFKYVDIGSISADLENPRIATSTTTAQAPSRARQHLASGDVVFSTVRPYQKKIALINDDLDGQIASTGFCVLRPKSHDLDSRYLFHYLKSDMLLNQVLPLQRGASYPAVGDSDVKQATIPLPDIDTQRGIAATLDSVVGTIKSQKGQLQSIIEVAQTLRRSLLHKAFSGELVEEK